MFFHDATVEHLDIQPRITMAALGELAHPATSRDRLTAFSARMVLVRLRAVGPIQVQQWWSTDCFPDGSSAGVRRRRQSPARVAKLIQMAIELRFQAIAAESSECLEHQIDTRKEQQSDPSDGEQSGKRHQPIP